MNVADFYDQEYNIKMAKDSCFQGRDTSWQPGDDIHTAEDLLAFAEAYHRHKTDCDKEAEVGYDAYFYLTEAKKSLNSTYNDLIKAADYKGEGGLTDPYKQKVLRLAINVLEMLRSSPIK